VGSGFLKVRYSRHVTLRPSASDSINRSIEDRLINNILRLIPRRSGMVLIVAFTSRRLISPSMTERLTPA
jgi:hypothetical protein